MDLNEIINFLHGYIFYHPFISMGIAAALGILIYIKPKEMLKIIVMVSAVAVICYIAYYIWGATQSGYLHKDEMIHKSL